MTQFVQGSTIFCALQSAGARGISCELPCVECLEVSRLSTPSLSPFPWIPAHVAAARSMAICIGSNQRIQRAWPFKVAGDEARASAAPHAPKALAPATVPPVGNTGGTHIRSETRG